jgi:hypothetical protein
LAFANSAVALQAPIDLGTTANYVVLAGTGITNTGPTTASGDAGADFGSAPTGTFTGDTSVTTTGTKFTSVVAQTTLAKTDLVDAYDDAAGRTPFTVVSNLTGNTYTTGVYHSDSTISLDSGGTVTLDAENDPDAVFIFQAGSSLITGSASVVALVNGAQACNVYWQVGSDATFGTTTDFSGHVFALTSIVAQTGATFDGQLLARNGTVTLDTNTFVNDGCADTGGSGGGGGGGTDEGLASTGVDDWTLPIVVGLSASLIVVAVFVVRHRRRIGRHSA